eukprot:Sro2476_g328770.2  (469) ;mRNA; f:6192-7598
MTAGAAGKIVRWTKNSLARNKQAMIDPSNFSRVLAPPVLDLARDVSLRLQDQRSQVEKLQDYVTKSLEGGSLGSVSQENIDPNVGTPTAEKNKKVIATSSQPYWWNQLQKEEKTMMTSEERQKRRQALEKARQNLHNLNKLHENTQEIAETFWAHLETNKMENPVLDKREQKWLKATFRQIRDRHALTVEDLAEFAITTRPYWDPALPLDDTVMDFLRGRMGVQLLCEHALSPKGMIYKDCHLLSVLEDATNEAQLLCESHYSHLVTAAPEVVIVTQTIDRSDEFTIVQPWIHYVLVELLKNAMAVSMERMTKEMEASSCSNVLPPTIFIAIDDHHDEEDKSYLSIDVLDQGGGFKNPDLAQNTDILFDFVRTKKTMWDRLDDQQTYAETRSPMQGLGVGLCLSRLMMQHFGGTVELASHPPLSLRKKQSLIGDSSVVDSLEAGCIASIKLLKDLDHKEPLYASDDDE